MEICLRGLGPQYKSFKTSILTRDSIPSFPDLVSMLVVEERNQMDDVNKGNSETEGQALYNSAGRGHGRFGSARTNNNQAYRNLIELEPKVACILQLHDSQDNTILSHHC